MPRVYNKYDKDNPPPKDAVYIGRPGPWGNPFIIGKDGTREEVIAKYRHFITYAHEEREMAKVYLKGKDLVCFCAPLPCHGDVLLEIANS